MKTEKEKMINSEPYNPMDKQLIEERKKAKELCFQLNNISSADYEKRTKILKELFNKFPDGSIVESNFFCDYGYNISAGEGFYVNHNCVILDCAPVLFGERVFIGPNCGFYTAIHPIDAEDRAKGIESAKPITVGNDVWIGGNVTILAGVTIGDNVVIGAGSVVAKDIPSNVVAFGNPCKVSRYIQK